MGCVQEPFRLHEGTERSKDTKTICSKELSSCSDSLRAFVTDGLIAADAEQDLRRRLAPGDLQVEGIVIRSREPRGNLDTDSVLPILETVDAEIPCAVRLHRSDYLSGRQIGDQHRLFGHSVIALVVGAVAVLVLEHQADHEGGAAACGARDRRAQWR